MIKLFNINFVSRGIAIVVGVATPISLLLTIPLFFKPELSRKEDESPVIIELMALQMPKQTAKPIKEMKSIPKVVKKTQPKPKNKPPLKKMIKKTLLVKATNIKKDTIKPIFKPIPDEIKDDVTLSKEIAEDKVEILKMPVPVPIFTLTKAPQFLHREKLIYPEGMRLSGITGVVKLAVLISKEGNVHRVKVLKSGGDEFDEAAKKALFSSTFIPAKIGNKNVAVELRMPVKFRLL